MTPILLGVPAAEIDAVWPLAEPLISAACRRGRGKESAADIRAGLSARDLQLWLAWACPRAGRRPDPGDGAVVALAVTEIVCHPLKRCCRIRICTGRDRKGWQRYLPVIERWARDEGCAAMELIARPGWSRLLGTQGYATTHLFCEKEL